MFRFARVVFIVRGAAGALYAGQLLVGRHRRGRAQRHQFLPHLRRGRNIVGSVRIGRFHFKIINVEIALAGPFAASRDPLVDEIVAFDSKFIAVIAHWMLTRALDFFQMAVNTAENFSLAGFLHLHNLAVGKYLHVLGQEILWSDAH